MGDSKGFLKTKRRKSACRPIGERVKDYMEVALLRREEDSVTQASRCMDCGTPFCHWACPAGNVIPEWNDLVFSGSWQKAYKALSSTNNFPEITGRLCPALCEYSCVLGINDEPVTIRENELAIIEYAFKEGLVVARPPRKRTGKKVAVIGSGPAGLACADQLNKAGHLVTVFEKDAKIGGILRYGIPDFKLEKTILDRRIAILQKEGIIFKTGVTAGVDVLATNLKNDFDAVCIATGSGVPRDINIEGRNLGGIYFAMDYLVRSNKKVSGEAIAGKEIIDAKGKKVVVIGGGDTGSDCVGTAHRQGAESVLQLELMPRPPECRTDQYPWPEYPLLFKTSSSHEEGGRRQWQVLTKKFIGTGNKLSKLLCVKVDFSKTDSNGNALMEEIRGSEFEVEAAMVFLAMGFLRPQKQGLLEELSVEFDARGNVKTDPCFMSSVKGVFACGDAHRGQSLVIWAISEGRRCAHYADAFLMGKSSLPVI
ncbi:MAG: glutamate synthase [Elusimicrobia bacterium RIFOXYA2_FULL_50_26]|nr:MAG: glutamate synthase [Elusimicrobia bacterium RIFOXYA2_FULL_50_26]OGS23134.1 MAG: glutamate synthase [Elusimicrobia bacterium RIFOXYB2_FULL_50_12]